MHKFLKIFTQTKLSGSNIDYNMHPIEILKKAESERNVFRFRPDIHFCPYKVVYKDIPGVLLIFTIKLPNTTTGSSSSSEMVMDIVEMLENLLSPIDDYKFFRNMDGVNKNLAVMRIIKTFPEMGGYNDI